VPTSDTFGVENRYRTGFRSRGLNGGGGELYFGSNGAISTFELSAISTGKWFTNFAVKISPRKPGTSFLAFGVFCLLEPAGSFATGRRRKREADMIVKRSAGLNCGPIGERPFESPVDFSAGLFFVNEAIVSRFNASHSEAGSGKNVFQLY